MKTLVLVLCLVFISGCAYESPYTQDYRNLEQAYKAGGLTYDQYVQHYYQIQGLEQQYYANQAQAWRDLSNNINKQGTYYNPYYIKTTD